MPLKNKKSEIVGIYHYIWWEIIHSDNVKSVYLYLYGYGKSIDQTARTFWFIVVKSWDYTTLIKSLRVTLKHKLDPVVNVYIVCASNNKSRGHKGDCAEGTKDHSSLSCHKGLWREGERQESCLVEAHTAFSHPKGLVYNVYMTIMA